LIVEDGTDLHFVEQLPEYVSMPVQALDALEEAGVVSYLDAAEDADLVRMTFQNGRAHYRIEHLDLSRFVGHLVSWEPA
jgi:hypothetical protein